MLKLGPVDSGQVTPSRLRVKLDALDLLSSVVWLHPGKYKRSGQNEKNLRDMLLVNIVPYAYHHAYSDNVTDIVTI